MPNMRTRHAPAPPAGNLNVIDISAAKFHLLPQVPSSPGWRLSPQHVLYAV